MSVSDYEPTSGEIFSDHKDDDLENFVFGGHEYTINRRYKDHT